MKSSENTYLVLGASGFLGQAVTSALLRSGHEVRAFDINHDLETLATLVPGSALPTEHFEVIEASVFDQKALSKAMEGVDTVCNFLSFSTPSSLPNFMSNELETTIRALDIILQTMIEQNVSRIVLPSSGGTLYGDTNGVPANESHALEPISSYGAGKLVAEELISFYARVHNLHYLLLRISNPYGAVNLRRLSQGVIDVFLQKIRLGEPLQIWGSTQTIRDYIFVDDFLAIFLELIKLRGSITVNVGSGQPTTLADILQCIEAILDRPIHYETIETAYRGLPYSVLDISRLKQLITLPPLHPLNEGIRLTWERKMSASGHRSS